MAEKFKSRGRFILASVGAAVGLGNALRFPGLCAKYGGGAFLLIYLLALAVLGIPLLNAEIALGRKVGGGAPKCMQSLAKGGAKLGWAQCANSVFTAILYAGMAGWILSMAFAVFPLCARQNAVEAAPSYFFDEVLHSGGDGVISGISPLVLVCIAAVWAVMFICLKGGANSLSGAAKFTVFAPLAMFFAISVRGLLYENSPEALRALFMPDFSRLSSPEIWISALGQVFFSLSLAVGIMPAYGAYLPDGCSIFPSSLIIAAADAFVSVLASVALFTTLYGCGLQNRIGQSGIITAFSVYPAAMASLFGSPAACAAAGFLFYFSLSLMAVQSGVSMLEAALCPALAKFGGGRKKTAAAWCVCGGAVSLVYATTAADLAVEIADLFVNFYNVLALCILECLVLGKRRNLSPLAAEINRYSKKLRMPPRAFGASVKFLCPAVLILLAAPRFIRLFSGLPYPPWAQIAFGWGASFAALFAGFFAENFGGFKKRRKRQT